MSDESGESAKNKDRDGGGCLVLIVGLLGFAAWLTNPRPSKHAAELLSPEFQYNGFGEWALSLAGYKYRSGFIFSYVTAENKNAGGAEEWLSFGMFGFVRTFDRSHLPLRSHLPTLLDP